MGTDQVQRVLKNLGLTVKEAELYIFLAKYKPLRSGEIAKGIRTHRVEVYRMLKSLQTKGVIQATLESPTRFTIVPLENILDSFIKAKKEETAIMENTKQSVLNDWKKINKNNLQPSFEKFMVIQGNKKIYSKILQMIKETKTQLSIVIPLSSLARADHFDVFKTISNDPLENKNKFRLLTEMPHEKLNTTEPFFRRLLKMGITIKERNPNLGLKLSPRIVLRDKQEILLFIRPNAEQPEKEQEDVCLWTNCKTLVQTFNTVFENLWNNSTDTYERITEPENEGITLTTSNINADTSPRTYEEVINSAKEEIIKMTSSEGLIESKHITLLKDAAKRGVTVKIMTPITKVTWQTTQELSKYCSIKHAPIGDLEITIVDGKHLIQSKDQQPFDTKGERIPYFGTHFINDQNYVKKTRNILDQFWRDEAVPSTSNLDSAINQMPTEIPLSNQEQNLQRSNEAHRKMLLNVKSKKEVLLEKDVLNKIINAKKYPGKNWPNDIVRYYGSNALAIIHPPQSYNLPDMTIWTMHLNKQSSFGAADSILVFLWLKTPKGNQYVPVAFISDNRNQVEFVKKTAKNTPVEHNAHFVEKDKLQVQVQGNSMFAGWTVPISLLPPSYTLPPSCIMFEGYGPLTTTVTEFSYPSGVKFRAESNGYDAFVTLFHPESKYSAPGTDGRVHRDIVTTVYPA
jgi:sugar-specific transcriptional regulator TrmB